MVSSQRKANKKGLILLDLEKLERQTEELQKKNIAFIKKLFKFFKTMGISLAGYLFLSFIFLSIYDRFGFERTLIILLIGIFYIHIKKGE